MREAGVDRVGAAVVAVSAIRRNGFFDRDSALREIVPGSAVILRGFWVGPAPSVSLSVPGWR